MAREIEANGCKSDRIQTIRKNFVQLLDDRIAGKNVPGAAAAPSGPARQPAVAPTRPPVPAAPQPVAPAMPIPYTTRITVTSIDAIDLTSADETRTYRAKVESAIFNGKTVPELAVGTEVLLKVSRQIQPNQPKGYEIAVVKIQAVSTTVSGKPVTLTTSPFTATGPIGESMKALMPTQLPAGSKMFFDVQSVK
jgi:hypothetical protein